MSPVRSPLLLSVRHDSWIRQQIRDMVLHLDAPVESAELLQAALISLARATAHFNWNAQRPTIKGDEVELAFAAFAREQVKADLVDEVRQMTHLSRLQRRRWALVKLARERVERRLQAQGLRRDPSPEDLSVLTGMSVTEIDALHRMARLGPWQPEEGSQHLMELRSLKQATPEQLRQAREDTRVLLQQLASLLVQCPADRLLILARHFGVECQREGQPVLPAVQRPRPGPWRRLLDLLKTSSLDRRPRVTTAAQTDLEELWPHRLGHLLHQAVQQAFPGSGAVRLPLRH